MASQNIHRWREARSIGLIDRLPRVACVQAAGASPWARYVLAREADASAEFVIEPSPETVATAIRIGAPRSVEKAIRVLDETRGTALAVSDAEILAAKAEVDRAGVGCEPASAASIAGLKRLVASRTIPRSERRPANAVPNARRIAADAGVRQLSPEPLPGGPVGRRPETR